MPNNPNKILLSTRHEELIVNRYPAGEDGLIKPGHLIEQFNHNTLGMAWQRNSSATNMPQMMVALPMDIVGQGIDTPYVLGDNLVAHPLHSGMVFYGILPSGQNITRGDKLQSNGDGNLKAASPVTAAGGVAKFIAQETIGPINVPTRVRAMVL